MRVFLDTNVIFSGIYSRLGAPARIIDAATDGRIGFVTSEEVVIELTRNFRAKVPHLLPALGTFLLDSHPEFASPDEAMTEQLVAAGFGSDAPIVATALGAEVDYFCTGDRRLIARLRETPGGPLRAVSPAALLQELESGGRG